MRSGLFLLFLMIAATGWGCARHAARGRGCCPGALTDDALEIVERGTLPVDTARVERLPAVDGQLGYPRPPGNYHALSKAECQCLAVRASQLGNLFDGERRALAAREDARHCSHEDNSLTYDVLRTAALEARNRSAADALNIYYQLELNEARHDLLGRSLNEVGAAVQNVDRLRGQGLKLPADQDQFARREFELRDQQVQVEGAVTQLDMELWQQIGMRPSVPYERLWPTDPLTVVVEPQDIEAEVQLGLATRPEGGMLRRLRRSLDGDSLGSVRAALSQVSPLLGLAPPSSDCDGLFGLLGALRKLHEAQRELPERRRQLNQYAQNREQEIAVEIREAAEMVDVRLRQVALAKENLDQLARRSADTEARAKTGGLNFADVSTARLATLQAEGDLLEKVVHWKIAQVRLAQAQGALVAECCP
ncbi:MAG TPA: TolC family protein [Pirellulales bacterium]|nr:TolC family protein [Pirellulales bacterium]